MNRDQKLQVVAEYKDVFASYGTVVLVEYAGINVAQFKSLRKFLYERGGNIVVTKNRLAKIALEGTQFDELSESFAGPVAMAYSKNPVELAKCLVEFSKTNESLVLKKGVMDAEVLTVDKIEALSKLPSLDELRAKLVGLIMAPAGNIVSIINNVPSSLVRVVKAHSEKAE